VIQLQTISEIELDNCAKDETRNQVNQSSVSSNANPNQNYSKIQTQQLLNLIQPSNR
jgi:hypothetical protein